MFCEGDLFDGLELLKCCGSGAFGTVFYCKDISDKKMAIKIISKTQLGQYWERELKGVKNYRIFAEKKPSLLQIYHVKDDDKFFYYTMEAADSVCSSDYKPDTLAHRLANGALPDESLFPILSKVFEDIKQIHENGFLHRDIKPDNILFINGQPKLADIGLFSTAAVTVTQMAGTLDYIPPEIRSSSEAMDSKDKNIRKRNDLYAFGMVIYCSVSGNPPRCFPSLPPETSLTPSVKCFWHLAQNLCSIDPFNRISSLDDLANEFERIEKIFRNGENWRSLGDYSSKSIIRKIKSLFIRIGEWLSHYAELLLFVALLLAYFIHILFN